MVREMRNAGGSGFREIETPSTVSRSPSLKSGLGILDGEMPEIQQTWSGDGQDRGTDAQGVGEDGLVIRTAAVADVPVILQFIRDLAEYEKLSQHVVATEADLRESLFGERPAAEALLAFAAGRPVGFALYFENFSTFAGKRGMYLEDLFVIPEARGRGYGKALFRALARIAVARSYCRLDWAVLDWNTPAIRFYQSLDAIALDEWTVNRLRGDALARLAEES
jgi:GNAT superfamily N-acetyltransferase